MILINVVQKTKCSTSHIAQSRDEDTTLQLKFMYEDSTKQENLNEKCISLY